SFDDVNISLFLSSPTTVTLPVRIFGYLEQTFDPLVTAVSSPVIVISVLGVVVSERMVGLGRLFGAE
ncbi:MAG TPA: ABC transporter permease, partial [Methylomirabilota bacterium]|nr:ABC transporter permease [Methylomirabilota bacterium]